MTSEKPQAARAAAAQSDRSEILAVRGEFEPREARKDRRA